MEALENHFVSEKTFNEARAIFGDQALVDLIGSVGYFSMLQICLEQRRSRSAGRPQAALWQCERYKKTA